LNFEVIFPVSKLQQNVACARTKSEAIISNVIGPHAINNAISSVNDIS